MPLRVMHILESMGFGGTEVGTLRLAKAFNRGNGMATICCLGDLGPLVKEAEAAGVGVRLLAKQDKLDLGLIAGLVKLIRKLRVNVVHAYCLMSIFYGGMAARLAGVPVMVATVRGKLYNKPGDRCLRGRLSLALPDCFVAISQYVADDLINDCHVDPKKIFKIYNGVPVDDFYPPVKDRLEDMRAVGIPPGALVVGTVARLSPEKGIHHLITAFKAVARENDNVILLLVGDGPERERLEALSCSAGLNGRVLFLGGRTDVPRLLSLMDLFVLPSLKEAISRAIQEAMATGLPVVATRVGGNPECVTDGVTGFLVPPGDPRALAKAILNLVSDRELSHRMGKAGRERALKQFSEQRMKEEYESLYLSLLKRSSLFRRHFLNRFSAYTIMGLASGKFLLRSLGAIKRSTMIDEPGAGQNYYPR